MTISLNTRSLLKTKRVSRLSISSTIYLKILWLRKTYSFNWAHKPLCEKYEEDLIKIKDVSVCRSCFFVYLGLISNLVFSLMFHNFYVAYGRIILSGLLLFTLPLSYPTLYKKLPRKLRDLLRFTMGYLIIQIFFVFLRGHFVYSLAAVLLSYILWKIYFKQRAKRKIDLCFTCNEYSDQKVCSGYKTQVLLIREYEEEATDYILNKRYTPKIINKN